MKQKTSRSSSVDKALKLLNCFTEQDYRLTLDDIVEKTEIPRSTVFRMLTSLEDYGYIKETKVSNKTWYSLGYVFLEKGFMVHRNLDIREYAHETMISLRNELNMNVQLAIREGMEALYIDQVQSWRPIRLYPAIGRRAPLYVAACPRILLAFLRPVEQKRILDQVDFQKFTSNSPNSKEEIITILDKIREQHYSYSYGELFEGTIALAVPVFYPSSNNVIAALSIIGLESDFEKDVNAYVPKLQQAAQEISHKIATNKV